MLIVADTSALLALASCDSLSFLDILFEEVRVPAAVFDECAVPGKPRAEHLESYLRDKVAEVKPPSAQGSHPRLRDSASSEA